MNHILRGCSVFYRDGAVSPASYAAAACGVEWRGVEAEAARDAWTPTVEVTCQGCLAALELRREMRSLRLVANH